MNWLLIVIIATANSPPVLSNPGSYYTSHECYVAGRALDEKVASEQIPGTFSYHCLPVWP